MIRRSLLYVALCVTAALPVACGGRGADEGDAAAADSTVAVQVRTAVAAEGPFQETVGAIGEVFPRPGTDAALGAPGPTRVARVYVTVGAHVRKGQPLVLFDQTTFAAEAQTAQAALTNAQHAYERAERLSTSGILPRKEAEQAAADLAAARGSAAIARRNLQLGTLRAPSAGVVTRMDAVPGASVDAGVPLVQLVDPAALDVRFMLSPSDAGHVAPGAAVTLSGGQEAGGESLGTGTVADVGAALDSASRGVPVRVGLTAPSRTVRVGETVFGLIQAGTDRHAITIPPAALVPAGEGYRVFVVDGHSIAHARHVTVGAKTKESAEITSGLAVGDRVVTYGAYGIDDSARVAVGQP